MLPHIHRALTGAIATSSLLLAQTDLDLPRIEHPWPAITGYAGGVDVDLACGSFLDNHWGRCAVTVRHDDLFLCFQPAVMEHFVEAGGHGALAIATVPARDTSVAPIATAWNGTDHLASVTATGLRLLHHTASGFADAAVTQPTASGWAGAVAVDAGIFGEGTLRARYVIGSAPGWVRIAAIDPQAGIVPVNYFPAAGSTSVLEAAFIDWVAGGAPEVVVLMTSGAYVLDIAGNVLAAYTNATTAGRLVAWRHAGLPAVTMVTASGSSWNLAMWQPGSAPVSGGSLTLPSAPTGLAVVALSIDLEPDLIISTGSNGRRVVTSDATYGPQAALPQYNILDVLPATLPSSPAANVAPLVVADMDADGVKDLVIASSAGDRLVVLRSVQTNTQFALNVSSPAEEATTVGIATGLGWISGVPQSYVQINPSGQTMLGVRLTIPAELQSIGATEIRAVTYPVTGGMVDTHSITHFKYALGSTVHPLFDAMLPLPSATVPPGGTVPHYVVEIVLANSSGQLCAPALLDVLATGDPDIADAWLAITPYLPPVSNTTAMWYYMDATWSLTLPAEWQSGVAPPSGDAASHSSGPNRYFGVMTVVKSTKASQGNPTIPTATTVTGGVGH